jgi:enoyl-CoA hydratase/carnithine racemase
VAAAIAGKGPIATRRAKAALQAARALPLDEGLALERDAFAGLLGTEDWVEGRAALAERRPAEFRGR